MKHIHHIIPRHMGGLNEPSNLISLTVNEHAEEHRLLFEKYGKLEDFVAWKSLSGYFKKEDIIKHALRIGGLKQGKINAKSGHMKDIQKLGSSIGGKKSSEVCREKKVNAFFDTELKKVIAKLGGKVQGKNNAKSGHLKRIAQLPNKRNSGKIWITDGINNKMIMKESNIEDGWQRGKTQKTKI